MKLVIVGLAIVGLLLLGVGLWLLMVLQLLVCRYYSVLESSC